MATERQRKALAKVLENGGNVSKAMKESGYSDAMAKNPHKLTQSLAFQHYMQEAGVTDESLVSVLKGGLNANKVTTAGDSSVDVQPDHPTRHKFLETALKIKGIGKEVDSSGTINFINQATFNAGKYKK